MDKKAVAWLYRQLPDLINRGIVSTESAERIKAYYGPIEEKAGSKTLLMVFGIIGVLLVGLGIILILAHNWASISRLNRLIISVGLLCTAQLVSGLVLFFKKDSNIWRESSGILHVLMLGAAMALVGQTYHLSDDVDAFLLTWMALTLPLIYLTKASGVSVLYLIGITVWSVSRPSHSGNFLVWPLLAAVLPFYLQLIRQHRLGNATVLLSWCLNLCFFICFSATFGRYFSKFGLLIFSSLFSLHYMIGLLRLQSTAGWQAPFHVIGRAGGIGIAFMLTFNDYWRHSLSSSQVATVPEQLFVLLLLLLVLGGNVILLKRAGKPGLLFCLAPLLIGAAYLLQTVDTSGISATLLLNGYIVWLSISIIRQGVASNSIGIVNSGMLLLAALIFARFLDSNFSFVIRGMVFVLLGIGFLLTNWLMVRSKRSTGHHSTEDTQREQRTMVSYFPADSSASLRDSGTVSVSAKNSRLLLLFVLVAIIQLAVPVYMAWHWEDILQNGQQFSWQTAPVDPYDPFKGRYVDLNFKNTSGPVINNDGLLYGQTAYATIAEDSAGKAYISGVSAKPSADKLYVKVRINYVERNIAHVSLPFKRYYLPEHLAPAAETAYRQNASETGLATVRIKDGLAVIEKLYLNGKPLEEYLRSQ